MSRERDQGPSSEERIADALERIASALEDLVADDFVLNVVLADVDGAAAAALASIVTPTEDT